MARSFHSEGSAQVFFSQGHVIYTVPHVVGSMVLSVDEILHNRSKWVDVDGYNNSRNWPETRVSPLLAVLRHKPPHGKFMPAAPFLPSPRGDGWVRGLPLPAQRKKPGCIFIVFLIRARPASPGPAPLGVTGTARTVGA